MRMGKGKRVTLSCLTCGAPVRKMEAVKMSADPTPAAVRTPEKVNKHRRPPHYEAVKKRKKKKKKSLFSKIWDEVDDIFDLDDIFDFD